MTRLKLEDVTFWFLIFLVISLIFWMLSGSPTDTSAIIALAAFVSASEILIWKSLFNMDKRTAISFEKIKFSIERLDNHLEEIKTNRKSR